MHVICLSHPSHGFSQSCDLPPSSHLPFLHSPHLSNLKTIVMYYFYLKYHHLLKSRENASCYGNSHTFILLPLFSFSTIFSTFSIYWTKMHWRKFNKPKTTITIQLFNFIRIYVKFPEVSDWVLV